MLPMVHNFWSNKTELPFCGSALCSTQGESTPWSHGERWDFLVAFRTPRNCTYIHNSISQTDWNATHWYLSYLVLFGIWIILYNPELKLQFFRKFLDFQFQFVVSTFLHSSLVTIGISLPRSSPRCTLCCDPGSRPHAQHTKGIALVRNFCEKNKTKRLRIYLHIYLYIYVCYFYVYIDTFTCFLYILVYIYICYLYLHIYICILYL